MCFAELVLLDADPEERESWKKWFNENKIVSYMRTIMFILFCLWLDICQIQLEHERLDIMLNFQRKLNASDMTVIFFIINKTIYSYLKNSPVESVVSQKLEN